MSILFFLLIASGFSSDSLPKFECTVIQTLDNGGVNSLFRGRKYPSLALRSLPKGDWEFSIAGNKHILKFAQVKEDIDLINLKTIYDIEFKNSKLKLALSGSSPSRQGTLSKQTPPLEVVLAKVTCH